MFNLITLKDTIRISPSKFDKPLDNAAYEELRGKYEGLVDEDLGYVISVNKVEVNPVGRIVPGDGGTHHQVTFSIIDILPPATGDR